MKLTVGDKCYYPGQGPCVVGAIVQKVVCGTSASFYRLSLLDESRTEFFVPVGNLADLHLRPLLRRSEIPKLLERLKPRAVTKLELESVKNWRGREMKTSKMFSAGSIFELADAVESLTQLSSIKSLATDQRETLHRARKLLICEISEVMDESKSVAEARINTVLNADQSASNESPS
jgi:CarD family transcriptional regulator, regulator of rRNA transcription